MIVSSFLAWMDEAGPAERAEAVEMFAQTYLAGAMGGEAPAAVEAALTLVLDDPAVGVRRALALAFADRADIPRHIAVALAGDRPEVGALLIARSPLLTEADLVELALTAEGVALIAIAFRHEIGARTASALVSRGDARVGLALARNHGAEIAEADLATLVEAFGADPALREALLARPRLPASIRHRLMLASAAEPGAGAATVSLSLGAPQARLVEDGAQEATLAIARAHPSELRRFVAYLRENGHLTPGLLLRSLLGGDIEFLTEVLADLAEMRSARVAGLLRSRSAAPIAALLGRAGIPTFLEAPLTEAIRAAAGEGSRGERALSLAVIRAAQAACLTVEGEEGIRLIALLRRYEADAARAEARLIAGQLRAAVEPVLIEHGAAPFALEGSAEPSAAADDDIIDLAPAAIVASEPAEPVGGLPTIAEEPVPDLKSLIAQWRAEAAAREESEGPSPAARPENDDPSSWKLRLVA